MTCGWSKKIKDRLDPRAYNGATLAGLRGVVIKSHGGADNIGFLAAIQVAAKEAKLQLPERILAAIKQLEADKIAKQESVNN